MVYRVNNWNNQFKEFDSLEKAVLAIGNFTNELELITDSGESIILADCDQLTRLQGMALSWQEYQIKELAK